MFWNFRYFNWIIIRKRMPFLCISLGLLNPNRPIIQIDYSILFPDPNPSFLNVTIIFKLLFLNHLSHYQQYTINLLNGIQSKFNINFQDLTFGNRQPFPNSTFSNGKGNSGHTANTQTYINVSVTFKLVRYITDLFHTYKHKKIMLVF